MRRRGNGRQGEVKSAEALVRCLQQQHIGRCVMIGSLDCSLTSGTEGVCRLTKLLWNDQMLTRRSMLADRRERDRDKGGDKDEEDGRESDFNTG